MGKYPIAEEATISVDNLESMKADPSIVVVMAMAVPWSEGKDYRVLYWKNENGILPPWIKIAA